MQLQLMAWRGAGLLPRGRRPQVAVMGDANLERPERVRDCEEKKEAAMEVGKLLVEAGCRVVTGGQQGVMGWALRGARSALNFREGDTLAILPGSGPAEASEHAAWGWVLPSGLGEARNTLVAAAADAIVVIGGGPGTLSELCFAWMGRRCVAVVVLTCVDGLSLQLVGQALDQRPPTGRVVQGAASPQQACNIVLRALSAAAHGGSG